MVKGCYAPISVLAYMLWQAYTQPTLKVRSVPQAEEGLLCLHSFRLALKGKQVNGQSGWPASGSAAEGRPSYTFRKAGEAGLQSR